MTKKKSSKSNGKTRTSFMFASLHDDVVNAVSETMASPWFSENNSDRAAKQKYETHVMARFICKNNACPSNGWSSKKVTILIRGYTENGYNAVVFNQRCKACEQLGIMILNKESYVDRVAYRLQKWAGIPLEPQQHTRKKTLPHESALCEGCKRGICRQNDDYDLFTT